MIERMCITSSGTMNLGQPVTFDLALAYIRILKEGDTPVVEEKVYPKRLKKHYYYLRFKSNCSTESMYQIQLEQGERPKMVLGDIE